MRTGIVEVQNLSLGGAKGQRFKEKGGKGNEEAKLRQGRTNAKRKTGGEEGILEHLGKRALTGLS